MISYENALSKAMSICSKAEKCISEIQEKLRDWDVAPTDAQKVIETLINERFIDEERFALFFVRDKFKFNQWGKVKIAFMLKSKRFPADLIQQSLDDIDDDEYQELLEKLLREKARKTKFVNEYDKKAKLYRFAQSRGFENETIGMALKNIDKGFDD
jgi:regulatory protein